MAELECNNGQDGFSPTENGDIHPEDRSRNIDYTEDLWLASGEDSSGPYAQQPRKVVTQEQLNNYSCHSEVCNSYSNSYGNNSQNSQSGDGMLEQQALNDHGQVWSEELQDNDVTVLQPATGYMNGLVEQNGVEFESSEDEKDFVQLVPAGSYVENGGVSVENGGVSVENLDKTFTPLMPAAAVGGSEIQQDYTSMIGNHQQQIVYYGSSDSMSTDPTNPMDAPDNPSMSYGQALQMATIGSDKSGSRDEGNNAVYISVDGLDSSNQTVTPGGNFTVLSPAMIRMTNVNSDRQSYISKMADGSYQHISTLPFVQNSAYSSQTSFGSYSAAAPAAVNSGDRQHYQGLQQSDYSSDQTSFSSCDGTALAVGSTLTPSIQTNVIEYQEEDEEEEEDQDEDNQDMEDNSVEFSEFCCPVCNEAFVDQTTLDDHVNNHPPLKTFICETCSKAFATRRYLKYHRKNHCKRAGSYEGRSEFDENDPNGEAKRFSCNVCNRPFRVLKCMKVHKKKKHDIMKEYTCQNCAVTFNSSHDLLDHPCEIKGVTVAAAPQIVQSTPPPLVLPTQKKKKKLKNAKPACDICGKTFSDRISVDIHRVKHIEEELYPCDMCDEDHEVDTANHLAVHFRIRFFTDDNQHILEDQKAATVKSDDGSSVPATPVHNPDYAMPQSAPATPVYISATPTHPSGTAVSAGNSVTVLDYPTDMHSYEQPAGGELEQCDVTHEYTEFVEVHPQDETQTNSTSNFETNQNITSNQSLLVNQQQESRQQEHNEDKSDVYNPNLTDGEVVHDANGSVLAVTPKKKKLKMSKVHMCDICNKSFGDTSKLELHYKSNHLNDRPYQCDVCEKSFFTKWKLQRHMLSHLEQKPHSCPMCSKSFVERGKLEAHYRTHLGTKPYKCEQCPKAFTVKSQLSIHQRRIHSTDQPFGCLVCGKAFLWKSGLDKHMRKHTREKPYICESCGIKYSNKANLIVHMSKAHNQTYIDKQSP